MIAVFISCKRVDQTRVGRNALALPAKGLWTEWFRREPGALIEVSL